jgi:very-short-patch-repair endonuclease
MTSSERPRAHLGVRHAERVLVGPFRGRDAVARGLITPAQLRGPRFQRLFQGVYVRRPDDGQPVDLLTRSRAAFLLLGEQGALAGYSAAELLRAECAPREVPAEVVAPGTGIRPREGLLVHRDRLDRGETWRCRGCRVTSPLRTAWDLGRRLDRVEAVVAIDALARRGRFAPKELLALRVERPRARGASGLDERVARADPRAESPMETRLRLLLGDHGLPAPDVQYELMDRHGFVLARFDLAYPRARLAIEYDGEEFHRYRRGADNHRDIDVSERGWETMRFEAADVLLTPRRTADAVARLLAVRTVR